MKRKIQVESTSCDYCGKSSYEECIGCGKDACWECQKVQGKKFNHAVHFQGSHDGFYCNECLAKEEIRKSSLFKAYSQINALRNEYKLWWEDFNKREKVAEDNLKKMIN